MKQLLILSGKGGTGKTTIATAFIKLAEAKAYADCDVDAPNLHIILTQTATPLQSDYYGLPKAVIDQKLCTRCDLCRQHCRFDAIEASSGYVVDIYACEGCGLCEAVCPEGAAVLKPDISGTLKLYSGNSVFSTATLKMGRGNSGLLVTEVKNQMVSAVQKADLAIIDGSPGIGCAVIASMSGVDMVLVVAEPSLSGMSDMKRIIKVAESFQVNMAVCVNKWDTNNEITEEIENFCFDNQLHFVGKIPFDVEAVKAINEGMSIVDTNTRSGIEVKYIFKKIMEILFKENN